MECRAFYDVSADTLGDEIITIYVGYQRKSFKLHKKLFCARSPYLAKIFKEGCAEAEHLPHDNSDAFDGFVNWVYRDQLPLYPQNGLEDTFDGWAEFCGAVLRPLFYIAEKLSVNELCNKIMDLFQDMDLRHGTIVRWFIIEEAYKSTHHRSKLRQYCGMIWLHRTLGLSSGEPEQLTDVLEGVKELRKTTPEFGYDCLELCTEYGYQFQEDKHLDPRERDDISGFGECFFHEHAEDEACHLSSP